MWRDASAAVVCGKVTARAFDLSTSAWRYDVAVRVGQGRRKTVQLAAALNSLRGSGGGGLNPLGKIQGATGFDRLKILGADEGTGRGTALAVGQYLADDIYVEVITDTRGFTATQIEIALTKALSVLSSVSTQGGQGVNFRYSKDY